MGRLSTHVLDTSRGKAGAGMAFALYRRGGEVREKLAEGVTTVDGRASQALLEGEGFRAGRYQLVY